jgi:hypothetical protein
MTAKADIVAISLTPTALAAAQKQGVNLAALVTHAGARANELSILLKQILAFHPNSGGDAANFAALQAVIAELA